MRLPTNNTPGKKRLIIITALVVIVGAGALLWFLQQKESGINEADSSINYDPPTEEEKDDPTQKQTDPSGASKDPGATPPPTPDLSVTITRAGQAGAGQPLNIRTVVTGTSGGVCDIILQKDGQQITKTAEIAFEVSSASCNIDIPANEFSASGEWQLNITAVKDGSKSAPATQQVTISK